MAQNEPLMKLIKRLFYFFIIASFMTIPFLSREAPSDDPMLFTVLVFGATVIMGAFIVFSIIPAYLKYQSDKKELDANDPEKLFP